MATEKDFRVKSSLVAPTSLQVGSATITSSGTSVVLPANSTIDDGAGGSVTIGSPDLTGYATETYVNNAVGAIDLSGYVTTSAITNYLTISSFNTQIAGYTTTTDLNTALAAKANTSSLATVATSGNYNDLSNTPTLSAYATQTYVDNSIAGLTLADIADANLTSIADNDLLQYDSANSEWVNVSFDDIKELDWTTVDNYRYLTGFRENGSIQTVRTADFASYNGNNKLRLLIATFTPGLSASISPSSPSWDQPISSFSVSVDNPTDITNQYVNEVASISASTGSVSALSTFSAGNKSNTPAGGVDWTQTFSTDADSYIRSNATTGSSSGGSANGTVSFNYYDGSSTTSYGSTASWSVNWQSPSNSISMTNLSGNTFLQTYTSTSYSVSHSGMSSSGNVSHTVTAVGGTVSNSTNSGTFTFDTPIHKDNTGTSRTLSLSTIFTRPSSVTGTGYTYTNNTSDTSLSASFTYPSFWIFTTSTNSPPPRADIISGTGFEAAVTTLTNQTKSFAGTVTNNSGVPQAFWFAVRSSASQPTSFKTGASSSLLSDVTPTTGTVGLEPDTPPSGYNAETYNLYGITLQAGDTYVSIS